LPGVVYKSTNFCFSTPSEIASNLLPISTISVPYPISWADEERDLTSWLGNELQVDAFNKLYSLTDKVVRINDEKIQKDWKYLQASDHFYYMSTKFFSDGATQAYFNPYDTPYEAYINYMNVLSDFSIRVNSLVPESTDEQEIANLTQVIAEKDELLHKYESELKRLKSTKTKIKTPAKSTASVPVKGRKSGSPKKEKTNLPKAGKK
jgi:alpha-amylase